MRRPEFGLLRDNDVFLTQGSRLHCRTGGTAAAEETAATGDSPAGGPEDEDRAVAVMPDRASRRTDHPGRRRRRALVSSIAVTGATPITVQTRKSARGATCRTHLKTREHEIARLIVT